MYVKLNFGPDAGKIRDLAAEAAIGLLNDGRASRAFSDEPTEPVKTPIVPVLNRLEQARKKRPSRH